MDGSQHLLLKNLAYKIQNLQYICNYFDWNNVYAIYNKPTKVNIYKL
jgi:hypothetical protein